MRINPIIQNRVNFQCKNCNEQNSTSPLKKAAKAVIIVPFLMPIMMGSCDKDHKFDIEEEWDHCYEDTTATDSVEREYHSRAMDIPIKDAKFELIG